MKIKISTSNCKADAHYVIEELATAEVNIKLEFEKIVSSQSRKQRQRDVCKLIQDELSKYQWLIAGSVNVEFAWYLNALERQETDRVGDIDNITKPILDSLVGINGILIDDSQIGSLYTLWMSRNEQVEDNLVKIKISFNNDECIDKKHLIFIQYTGAVCIPCNVNFSEFKSMIFALHVIKIKLRTRNVARNFSHLRDNTIGYLVCSSWDIHRTRLNGFDKEKIYKLDEFKHKCNASGLTFRALLHELKCIKNNKLRNISQGLEV